MAKTLPSNAFRNVGAAVLIAGLAAAPSPGGGVTPGVWQETEDTPAGVPDAQETRGLGPLLRITGRLNGPGDSVDTYAIIITDPAEFYATLDTTVALNNSDGLDSPFAEFDTRLWLWTADGEPLLANDDTTVPDPPYASTISDPSTFAELTGGSVSAEASGVTLQAGQTYLLSISHEVEPIGTSGGQVFDFTPFRTELAGPADVGEPFDEWSAGPSTGSEEYAIALRGADFVVQQLPGDANGDGVVDLLDLDIVGANFGLAEGATIGDGDFNGDGAVDLIDLDILGRFFRLTLDGDSIPEPHGLVAASAVAAACAVLSRRRRGATRS